MRDKLIKLLRDTLNCEEEIGCINCEYNRETDCKFKRKADYLLEYGVIVPPVEIGQTVWYIHGGYYNSVNKRPCAIEVTEINKKRQHGKVEWGFIANGTRYRFSSIGKSVFLSLKEAEQALKERTDK